MGGLLCCVQVDQSTVAIKEQFGKFDEVLQPGCHCLPWFLGKRVVGHLSLRLQQLDVRCETKTKVTIICNFYNLKYVTWEFSILKQLKLNYLHTKKQKVMFILVRVSTL